MLENQRNVRKSFQLLEEFVGEGQINEKYVLKGHETNELTLFRITIGTKYKLLEG